jgi:hypothetical protein
VSKYKTKLSSLSFEDDQYYEQEFAK